MGGGKFLISKEDEEIALEGPRRRVCPQPTCMHEDPPMIPVEDKLPIDPYNLELRAYQDDIGRRLNHTNMNLEHMMSHMNIPCNESFPDYPYIRNWEER